LQKQVYIDCIVTEYYIFTPLNFNKTISTILIFLLGLQIGYTQNFTPIFKNITEQLPSSEVHNIYQDAIGYMWFATDRGITRYDGQNFLTPNTEQYFTSSVFNFFEENKHKVWISTGENELFWFNPFENKLKLHPYLYNNILIEAFNRKKKTAFIRNIQFSDNDCKITFSRRSGYLEINKGIVTIHYIHDSLQSMKQSNLYLNVSKPISHTNFKTSPFSNGKLYVSHQGKNILIDANFSYTTLPYYGVSSEINYINVRYFAIGQYLITINNSVVSYKKMPSEILKIFIDDNSIFIGTFKGAYQLNKSLNIINSFLDKYTITDIKKDIENGYWFSTTDNGVYYSKSIHFMKLKKSETSKPSYIFIKNNRLLYLQKNNKLIINSLNGDFIQSFEKTHEHNGLIATSNKNIQKYLDKPIIFRPKENRHLFTTTNELCYINLDPNTIILDQDKVKAPPIKGKAFALAKQINDSTLYYIRNKELFSINVYSKLINKIILPSKKINAIHKFSNKLLIACQNEIYIYKNNKIKRLNLKSNREKIHVQNDSIFWTYGYNGLHKVFFTDTLIKIEAITTTNGLPTNEITSLTTDKENIWIGSKKGILKLDINYSHEQKEFNKIKFIVDSILVNNKQETISSKIKTEQKSTLSIYFKYIQFSNPTPIQFEYQINNSIWLHCDKNHIDLQNLNTGLQNIKIRKYNDPFQTILFEKSIEITPPYYKNIWFILLIISLSLSIIYYLIAKYNFHKNRKKENRIHTLQLELKLLTSQMNPHFTFNTINSIQYYILKNEKKEAIQYLSDFALLMRKTLDFSMNDQVNIKEELDYIELYIALENKRFDNNFIFEKHIQHSISTNSDKIPSLLIQPLIENIILHANYSKTQEKKIVLSIIKKENYYILKIIDFGAGISKKNNLEKHKSYGIDILKNRLKIYNDKNYSPSDIQFKFTDEINKTGTSVIIKLYPNENNYN